MQIIKCLICVITILLLCSTVYARKIPDEEIIFKKQELSPETKVSNSNIKPKVNSIPNPINKLDEEITKQVSMTQTIKEICWSDVEEFIRLVYFKF